ncbi:MAG: A/G-specific adenine glycosylase [Chthoniobacterales bacterium]
MLNSRARFRRALLAWHGKHRRDLPWRRTKDPYAILVSEVMLQQTQVATVIPYYEKWLARFPDFRTLAQASHSDVLHAWQGLGYYARARNLHETARILMRDYGGIFPDSVQDIRKLPGLGRYSANAVATFAFAQSVPLVEANIARLLARVSDLQLPIDSAAGRQQLWDLAALLVPKKDAGRFNSALMDLGAIICTSRRPKCQICPVRCFCGATDPQRVPLKKPRAATKTVTEHHALTVQRGRVLLQQSQNRWRGMWILPRLPNDPGYAPIYTSEFPFTHHRITLAVHRRSRARSSTGLQWFPFHSLDSIPLPSPHRRALSQLLGSNRNLPSKSQCDP